MYGSSSSSSIVVVIVVVVVEKFDNLYSSPREEPVHRGKGRHSTHARRDTRPEHRKPAKQHLAQGGRGVGGY